MAGDAESQRQERSREAGRTPSPPSRDRSGALVQLDLLLRAHPEPEALLEGLQALRARGELADDDLPAVEATLMGLVGPRARPAAPTAHFKTLPREEQARLSDRMIADTRRVTAAAGRWRLDADTERDLLTTLERWAAIDEQRGLHGSLLDEFLRRVPVDELKRRASPEARGRLSAVLKQGRALGHLADAAPPELPSAWRDVLVKTWKGLPGGAASFAGGALQSLPTDYADRAGQWLQEQGVESLQQAGYSEDEAADVGSAGSLAGRAWGEGFQVIAGLGALGEAAKAGKLAKMGLAGAEAAEYGELAARVVGLAEDVNKLLTVTGPLLVGAFKVFTDLMKKAAAGHEITPADVTEALASRAVKEVLSALAEGGEHGAPAAASGAYKERKIHADDRRGLLDQATSHDANASNFHAEADAKRGQPEARSSRLNAVEQERKADAARERANAEGSAARRSVARYLLYTSFQRLLVNLAAILTQEVAKSAVARRENGTSQAALGERIRSRMAEVATATLREVATDVLTRLIFQEGGAFAAAPKVVQDSVKLGLDGITKIVAGWIERAWSDADTE